MAKKSKKSTKTLAKVHSSYKGKKLPRGYKQCLSCKKILNINKHICPNCGHQTQRKKSKQQIIKNLTKPTPKNIKTILISSAFNQLQSQQRGTIYPPNKFKEISRQIELSLRAKKSRQEVLEQLTEIYRSQLPISCITTLNNTLILIKSKRKAGFRISDADKMTNQAYGLQMLHQHGILYDGSSELCCLREGRYQYKIQINEHIMSCKALECNRVALQTGKYSIMILNLPVSFIKQTFISTYRVQDNLEISFKSDKIYCYTWLHKSTHSQQTKMLAGTANGHLYLIKVGESQYTILRYFNEVHQQFVTAVAECPLSTVQHCIFASGSYDGKVCIWNHTQQQPVSSFQPSNRKIFNLMWDNGGKFLLVTRDDPQQSCLLVCFYSFEKTEPSFSISHETDTRILNKNWFCTMARYSLGSQILTMADPLHGVIKIFDMEAIRKLSLKKSKHKQDEEVEKTYQMTKSASKITSKMVKGELESGAQGSFFKNGWFISDISTDYFDGTDSIYVSTTDGAVFLLKFKPK